MKLPRQKSEKKFPDAAEGVTNNIEEYEKSIDKKMQKR